MVGSRSIDGHEADRLRIVVLTSGPLLPVNRVFFERLAKDRCLELCGIVVDEYDEPRRPLMFRILQGLLDEGWPWLWFKLTSTCQSLIQKIGLFFFELVHPRLMQDESYEAWALQTGIPTYRVSDIHNEDSLELMKSLRPQLGVIVGGRILRDSVIKIPEYGTLSIHKGRVPEYHGGGPIGYWEVLTGEPSIAVTIHHVLVEGDAGEVLAEATIPIEECDTLESLRIKADLLGAQLYHEAIRGVARGLRQGLPQDRSRVRTYGAPSELRVWQLQKGLHQKAARRMPVLRASPSWAVRTRVLVQYAVLLPMLLYIRRRLIRSRRAPICIFFYHLVANRPLNHMCLPLEKFVKQIDFLRRYYKSISLDDAVEQLRSGFNNEIAVSITFDDGYENTWAVEYLRYFGIPAGFFVSIGHVIEGTPFEHDRKQGFEMASPIRRPELRRLSSEGFLIGSHGIYHEDFGKIDATAAEHVLRESRRLIGQVTGKEPEHFSFPIGQRGKNMTEESCGIAKKYYRYVYSAYGGYNFPCPGRWHFLRICNPPDVLELVTVMDGYTGFRQCVPGNAWGLKTARLTPYADDDGKRTLVRDLLLALTKGSR